MERGAGSGNLFRFGLFEADPALLIYGARPYCESAARYNQRSFKDLVSQFPFNSSSFEPQPLPRYLSRMTAPRTSLRTQETSPRLNHRSIVQAMTQTVAG